MLITKEHQESLLEKYIKEGKSADECIGFIDGMNAMIEYIKTLTEKQKP